MQVDAGRKACGLSRSGSFAPSALSVLYENQAMKMERAELKSELRLISARVRRCASGLVLSIEGMSEASIC